jgi:hypothetical protein
MGEMHCAHGHGTRLVPAPEKGEGWKQEVGRGCCPHCGSGPAKGKIAFLPGEDIND